VPPIDRPVKNLLSNNDEMAVLKKKKRYSNSVMKSMAEIINFLKPRIQPGIISNAT